LNGDLFLNEQNGEKMRWNALWKARLRGKGVVRISVNGPGVIDKNVKSDMYFEGT